MDLFISETLLNKMANGNSCMDLPEGKAFELFTFHNKIYISVASCSSGKCGVHWVNAYECVLLENFKGDRFSYQEHYLLVNAGKKERGYENVKFSFKGREWVIVNSQVSFFPTKEDKPIQLSFF